MATLLTTPSGANRLDALDGYHRIAPDLRGMGQSDAPDLGYGMGIYAADLAALLDVIGVDEVILCGLSMGGYIAFEFLRNWRSRVRGLVLMDTRAEADSAEAARARDASAAVAREGGAAAVADAMLPKVLSSQTVARHPEIVERVRRLMARTAVPGIVGALASMRDRPDSESLLPTLAGLPTLIIVGEADSLTPPENARAMAQAIPGARLVIIPDAGHLPPVEQPAGTTAVLQEFLRSLNWNLLGRSGVLRGGGTDLPLVQEVLPHFGSGIAAKQFGPGAPFFLASEYASGPLSGGPLVNLLRFSLTLGSAWGGITVENVFILFDERRLIRRNILFRKNRGHRALRLARTAVDAFIGMNIELVLTFIDAVHRTHVYTGSILHSDAGFDDHIGHATAPERMLPHGAALSPKV
jgi:3-oxoadipate enol-lactonase